MTDVGRRMSNAEALDVMGRAHRDGSVAPIIPHARSTMSRICEHVSFSRCVHAARLRTCEKQSTNPFIELHRIAFARRKTAGAASLFNLVRDRAG
jgi:hypothetical protein